MQTAGVVQKPRHTRAGAPMTGTTAPYHVGNEKPAPPDGIQFSASLRFTQPVKIEQKRSEMVELPGRENQSSGCVHGGLKSVEQLTR